MHLPGPYSPTGSYPPRHHSSHTGLRSTFTLLACLLLSTLLCILALSPLAMGSGWLIESSTTHNQADNREIFGSRSLPITTTITDRNDTPIAFLYEQRRLPVESSAISPEMKKSIVAIEDRRFYEHTGVDLRGTLRASLSNVLTGSVMQGASTLNQQYVKNYLYLITAESDSERQEATEQSMSRKIREMRLARTLDQSLSKDAILTRYLNLVSFGNGAFGIQEASYTYFNKEAKDLTTSESALLAGIVQSTTYLNPYTNPEGARERRNQVLDARVSVGSLSLEQAEAAKSSPLGILSTPRIPTNGCIGTKVNGFFCEYVLQYLSSHGLDISTVTRGGYRIRTTLDPQVQESAHHSLTQYSPTGTPGVTQTLNFISPTDQGHEVLAMASSRDYGLDSQHGQTVLPLPFSTRGHGAGSIFKIFAAAAAIEQGMNPDTLLDVPTRVEKKNMGEGGAENCPPETYCVENSGQYPEKLTLAQALATSPNTPFIDLEEKVGIPSVVDMAVKLGLRSYQEEEQDNIASFFKKNNLGSFVLGPTAVNPLELSNVAATLADEGRWCEPNPILAIYDSQGSEVPLKQKPCEQVLSAEVIHQLSSALSRDTTEGTASAAARALGWNLALSAKTGTTESHQSAAFLGYTSRWAGSVYTFNEGSTVTDLCSFPLRQCPAGNLFGGAEPAHTFLSATPPLIQKYP